MYIYIQVPAARRGRHSDHFQPCDQDIIILPNPTETNENNPKTRQPDEVEVLHDPETRPQDVVEVPPVPVTNEAHPKKVVVTQPKPSIIQPNTTGKKVPNTENTNENKINEALIESLDKIASGIFTHLQNKT